MPKYTVLKGTLKLDRQTTLKTGDTVELTEQQRYDLDPKGHTLGSPDRADELLSVDDMRKKVADLRAKADDLEGQMKAKLAPQPVEPPKPEAAKASQQAAKLDPKTGAVVELNGQKVSVPDPELAAAAARGDVTARALVEAAGEKAHTKHK